ncbi:MaoC family dehydratase [Kineococcus sp. SYSU DK001]|uniref:MaoC family dehydratase n=1 Tax=Kineococcus sp. SYSU DK001 TaxID=3383122 RepID=UPI003D7E6449
MPRFEDLDALTDAVGTHLGYGEWISVEQPRIDQFADATGDHQWIHVDPVRAAQGPFGTTIAHGFMTLALVPALVGGLLEVGGLSMEVNYGLNKVRFPSPLPSGSRIRAGAELVEVTPTERGTQTVSRVTVEIEGSSRPAVVADWVLLLVP